MNIRIPHDIRVFLLVTGAVSAAAVLITIIVMLAQSRPAVTASDENGGGGEAVKRELSWSDFLYPDERDDEIGRGWVPFRAPKERWSAEDVSVYWNDPEELLLEFLVKKNRESVLGILSGVP